MLRAVEVVAVVAATAAVCAAVLWVAQQGAGPTPTPGPAVASDEDDGSATEAWQRRRALREATVRLRVHRCEDTGSGSGFVIADNPGNVVVTNRHVVDGADEVTATTWDGREVGAEVTSVSDRDDLALLELHGASPPGLELGGVARLGTDVAVAGYPLGSTQWLSTAVVQDRRDGAPLTAGRVLRLSDEVAVGSSGGPVVDRTSGAAVGVVYAIEGVGGQWGTALAVSSDRVRDLLQGEQAASPPPGCAERR